MSNPPQEECSQPSDSVNANRVIHASDAPVEAVLFDSERDNVPKPFSGTLGALLGHSPELRAEKRGGRCFSLVRYAPGATRGNDGIEAVNAVVLDYDHITGDQLRVVGARLQGRLHAIYSSFRDRLDGDDDRRVRAIIITTRPMSPAEFAVVRAALIAEIGVPADEQAADPSRMWYMPASDPSRAAGAFIYYSPNGNPLDPATYLGNSSTTSTVPPPTATSARQPAVVDAGGTTLRQLKRRLLQVRERDDQDLLRHVIAGEPFAEPGGRNAALWRIMSIAAFMAPDSTPELLVQLVQSSLAAMAVQDPDDALTINTAADMARRALRDAHEEGVRVFERGDEAEVALALLDDLSTTTQVTYDEGQFWQYDSGIGLWNAVEDDVISRSVQDLAGAKVAGEKGLRDLRVNANMVRGVRDLAAGRACRRRFFEQAPAGFAFTNGFVRVDAAGIHLEPHSPENRARAGYPFAFDPDATAPRFERFLDEVFAGDHDACAKRALLQEFTGACLTGRATRQAKAIVMVGEGRNGKSTMQEIIAAVFPDGVRESVPPQDWEREYYRERLRGKLLNTVAELPKADILRSEAFKAIIAGDTITARAIRRSPVQFKPVAGHILAANTLPAVDDCSKAFWARIVVVTFNNEFSEQKGNVDRDLARTVITDEMPGLAMWALEGAARLLAQGSGASYTVPASHHAALAEWRLRADQVAEFLAEKTEPTTEPSKRTSGLALYAAYKTWAEVNGHRVIASNKFGERVKALGVRHVKPKDQRLYDVVLKEDIRRMSTFRREHAGHPPDPVIPRHVISPTPPALSCTAPVTPLPEARTAHPPGQPGSPDVSHRNGTAALRRRSTRTA